MAALHSVAEVKQDLIDALTRNGIPLRLEDAYLDDYAKIGSLMTDKPRCLVHLAKINTELLARVNSLGMRRRGRKLGGKKRDLKTAAFEYTYQQGQNAPKRQQFRETKGLLSSFLNAWEERQGFNQKVPQEEGPLPARPPELTEFLSGDDFRKHLLKHGFHWTDTAVGGRHGEYTHRLHWYIVCQEYNANNNWLQHPPLDLFKRCGDPEACHPKASAYVQPKDTVWDQIFDNAENTDNRDNLFRCPENFHRFLREEATMKRKDLWVLAQMIDSRALMAQSIGGTEITKDYQAFEAAHIDAVILRGKKTGHKEAQDVVGTIMWRELTQTPAFWKRV